MSTSTPTFSIGGELRVSRLGLGTMSLTGPGVWGAPRDPEGARGLLRRARERVDFFDTADSYGPNTAEELVRRALFPYRGIVVATKGGLTRQGPGRWSRDCRPEYLRSACEGSLRRLGVDQLDLYQLHTVDPDVPIEESVGALAELQQAGKIRHIGVCNVDLPQLERARLVAPVATVQNRFSLADRSSTAIVELCHQEGIGFVAWAPLGKGGLAGDDPTLARLADERGIKSAQLALAWVLRSSPATIAIPGTASLRHLEENLAATDVRLDEADAHALEGHEYRARRRPRRPTRLLRRVGVWVRS
jgi:aryl-alcohol dehydrogenase-like predicted oxidoreductase